MFSGGCPSRPAAANTGHATPSTRHNNYSRPVLAGPRPPPRRKLDATVRDSSTRKSTSEPTLKGMRYDAPRPAPAPSGPAFYAAACCAGPGPGPPRAFAGRPGRRREAVRPSRDGASRAGRLRASTAHLQTSLRETQAGYLISLCGLSHGTWGACPRSASRGHKSKAEMASQILASTESTLTNDRPTGTARCGALAPASRPQLRNA